jgi:ATP-dependent DNA helicase RecQ
MLDYEATEQCRMGFLQRCLDDQTRRRCGRCDNCAGAWFEPTSPTRCVRCGPRSAGGSGCPSSRGPNGRPGWTDWACRSRADRGRRGDGARAERWPGCPTSGGGSGCARLLREDAPVPAELVRAVVPTCSPSGEWSERPVGRRRYAVARPPHARRVARRATGRDRSAAAAGTARPRRAAGQAVNPEGNSAFRLAGVWDRLGSGPSSGWRWQRIPGPVLLVDDLVVVTVDGHRGHPGAAPGRRPGRAALRPGHRRLSAYSGARARVAELADAPDLGSGALGCAGSSPASRT